MELMFFIECKKKTFCFKMYILTISLSEICVFHQSFDLIFLIFLRFKESMFYLYIFSLNVCANFNQINCKK